MTLLYILSIFVIIGTALPILNNKHWLIRGQAYFRFWYFIVNIILITCWAYTTNLSLVSGIIIMLLFICAIISLIDIFPFSKFSKKEIKDCTLQSGESKFDILIYNVYQDNKEYEKLIQKVKALEPDIVLLLETNEKWCEEMGPLLSLYPYNIKAIQENTYGMMMLTKLKPLEQSVDNLSDDEIPSIECLVKIFNHKIRIRGLHPKPPIPGEAKTSKQKDKEFAKAAKRISQLPDDELQIVIGDLNDVVWSKASKRFKKTTGLKDPRIGRGTFSTFPTYFPIRFPLDHIFCSSDFLISKLEVLENIGSDHFPIYIEFCISD